jgi:ferredoxin-NADP reductase
MMSVIRSLTDRGWDGEMYLVFSVRLVKDIVFRAELAELVAKHPNLKVKITISGDPDTAWDGARGNITADLLKDFIPGLTPGRQSIMLCGPDAMMTAMRKLLVGLGIPDREIHQEAFLSPPPIAETDDTKLGAPPMSSHAGDAPLPEGHTAAVTFQKSQATTDVGDMTLLEAAEDADVAIPNECRSGICGQCKVKLLSGKVRMETQDALTAQDRSRGLVLACQARPTRDCVVDA